MKVSIVGYGRFGKTLHRLLGAECEVGIFHHKDNPQRIFSFAQTIFYCVPIESFETMLKKHRKWIQGHLLIDVLSVKEYPKQIFSKYLKNTSGRSLLTHPMFGPDSSRDGFVGLPIIIDQHTAKDDEYLFWKNYFTKRGLRVVEMTAREHDRLAADSQGLTHFVGRLLERMKMGTTAIDSLGTKKLYEVMDQTCNDTWQLFINLQNYNTFTKRMRLRLGAAYDVLYNAILPRRVDSRYIIFGIQGGKGSFNEQAIMEYIQKNRIKKYKIKYLYTSEKVLRAVHEGAVDFGIFAIHNAAGGIVDESTYAMARYKFTIVEELAVEIRHCLMKRTDANTPMTTIMAHPQVFRQCKKTLAMLYPNLVQHAGEGDLIDTAQAAKALAEGRVDRNTYILGPAILADLYHFNIVAKDLQDLQSNITSFFLVKR